MEILLHEHEVLASTNEYALDLAKAGCPEGTLVLAHRQTGGHGRMRRVWSSPVGGLWFSLVLRPKIRPQVIAQVTLLAGVAVTQALREIYLTDDIYIKWPNDILIHNKKVCGILAEMSLDEFQKVEYVIMGIGINVNIDKNEIPKNIKHQVQSLKDEYGIRIDEKEVLVKVIEILSRLYMQWQEVGIEPVLKKWCDLNCTLGKHVKVKDNDQVIYEGQALSIDEAGALVIRRDDGTIQKFNFGEISIRE